MKSFLKNIITGKNGAVVLMYHRISEGHSDPWDLCVSADLFDEHISKLKEKYHIIPMFRLAERLSQKLTLENFISITFDDGYLDNFEQAKCILEKHNVPATFFITGKYSRAYKKFWWDELEQLILHTPTLPDSVNITLNNKTITLLLGDARELTDLVTQQNKGWRYGDAFHNSRIKLYYELWSELKTMTMEEQQTALKRIKDWAGTHIVATPPLMNEEQIRQLSASGLFEIGGHTVNHPALGTLPPAEQLKEIKSNWEELQNISSSVTGLAYPYGHYNEQTPSLTKSSGYKYAVTTEERKVTHKDSPFEIPRFQVKNISADELLISIDHWKRH
jgi:peptidoglycan/xylan/chitin deacetylase (PgdA/CDA1 family)